MNFMQIINILRLVRRILADGRVTREEAIEFIDLILPADKGAGRKV